MAGLPPGILNPAVYTNSVYLLMFNKFPRRLRRGGIFISGGKSPQEMSRWNTVNTMSTGPSRAEGEVFPVPATFREPRTPSLQNTEKWVPDGLILLTSDVRNKIKSIHFGPQTPLGAGAYDAPPGGCSDQSGGDVGRYIPPHVSSSRWLWRLDLGAYGMRLW